MISSNLYGRIVTETLQRPINEIRKTGKLRSLLSINLNRFLFLSEFRISIKIITSEATFKRRKRTKNMRTFTHVAMLNSQNVYQSSPNLGTNDSIGNLPLVLR